MPLNDFDTLKIAIDAACSQESYLPAESAASSLGMGFYDDNSKITRTYDRYYSKSYDDGHLLTLHIWSYDTSKTFDIRPDINKFEIRLIQNEATVASHTNAFHDKF
ncbi:hypothetical protein ACMG4P_19615 [Pseudovibrio denitrificans]|uniref:hypothetical protein n=1 Tax=Pseudovibrio denitrificans TaxID=258256 RepID=UPI0039BF002A